MTQSPHDERPPFEVPDEIDRALRMLDGALEAVGSAPVELVAVGGAALNLLGLAVRPTRDVDVVAIRREAQDGRAELISSRPLPPPLLAASQEVATALALPEDWLNPGPTDLLEHGLPDGFEDRLDTRRFGRLLAVHFASRQDLIALKVFAAADQGPGRHVDDLKKLSPSQDELVWAAKWCRTHDNSEPFRIELAALLRQLGAQEEQEVVDHG